MNFGILNINDYMDMKEKNKMKIKITPLSLCAVILIGSMTSSVYALSDADTDSVLVEPSEASGACEECRRGKYEKNNDRDRDIDKDFGYGSRPRFPRRCPHSHREHDREEPDDCDKTVAECAAYGWYCMRNSEHKLPPIDRGMEFITEYNAVYGDVKAAENGDKVIYLTFDAGYENGNISKILDVLKKHNACGAFFILENLVKREPDLVKRMQNEGHLLCNHTMKHPDMTEIDSIEKFAEQVEGLEKYAMDSLGVKIAKYYRPPEGKFSRRDLDFANKLGYRTVLWSFAYADWDNNKQPSLESAEKKIIENAHPGEIMLLHPTSSTNAAILDSVLTELEAEGYRFGSLDEIA